MTFSGSKTVSGGSLNRPIQSAEQQSLINPTDFIFLHHLEDFCQLKCVVWGGLGAGKMQII